MSTNLLEPCPASPNCVCSAYPDDTAHAIEPFRYETDADTAWAAVRRAVDGLPRTRVVTSEPGYLRAESRTLLLRFVDDLEFRLDATAGVIHVRSASRTGYSDLGVNRRRVETLRVRFREALSGR